MYSYCRFDIDIAVVWSILSAVLLTVMRRISFRLDNLGCRPAAVMVAAAISQAYSTFGQPSVGALKYSTSNPSDPWLMKYTGWENVLGKIYLASRGSGPDAVLHKPNLSRPPIPPIGRQALKTTPPACNLFVRASAQNDFEVRLLPWLFLFPSLTHSQPLI